MNQFIIGITKNWAKIYHPSVKFVPELTSVKTVGLDKLWIELLQALV